MHIVLKADLPEYVFRGTTCNFKGGAGSISKPPFTCPTTVNPLKAYYFARFCENEFGSGVVYIAKSETLYNKNIIAKKFTGRLPKIEEEIVWFIKPRGFTNYVKVTSPQMKCMMPYG